MKEKTNHCEHEIKMAAKLKALMALFSIGTINLSSGHDSANEFKVDDCRDYLNEIVEPPLLEIQTLAEELTSLVIDEQFYEIQFMETGDGTSSITLDEGLMKITVDIPYQDERPSESEYELDLEDNFDRKVAHMLSAEGITSILIHYSGSGDSGGIDDCQFLRGETVISNEEISHELQDAVETYIFRRAQADFNNDGCYGKASIRVREGIYTCTIENSDYVSESLTARRKF